MNKYLFILAKKENIDIKIEIRCLVLETEDALKHFEDFKKEFDVLVCGSEIEGDKENSYIYTEIQIVKTENSWKIIDGSSKLFEASEGFELNQETLVSIVHGIHGPFYTEEIGGKNVVKPQKETRTIGDDLIYYLPISIISVADAFKENEI